MTDRANHEGYGADELVRKYHNDPLVHALVHQLGCTSFTNDDGVVCDGPSVADAHRVQDFLDALPDGFAKIDGQCVWLVSTDSMEVFVASDGENAIRPTPGPLYKVAHSAQQGTEA